MFNERAARGELARYRRTGPEGSTRRLIEALEGTGVRDATLLDIAEKLTELNDTLAVLPGAEMPTKVKYDRESAGFIVKF